MANTQGGTTIFCDTSALFEGRMIIVGIKYVGAVAGTVTLRDGSSSGAVVWAGSGTTGLFEPIRAAVNQGLYVDVTNGASCFIYLE